MRKGVLWYTTNVLNGAGSYHSGGVNACLGDGAVRFVSNTVNCGDLDTVIGGGTWTNGQSYLGETVYGVWGALGSAAGKDAASLP